MKVIRLFLWILWRIWFYILMGVPIVILSPLLILSILSPKTYPQFFFLARIWARIILIGMGFNYKIERDQEMEKGKSYMLVANHTSMADIMLMFVTSKNPFVFVGKKELTKIPVFGFFYKRTSIVVDRSSPKSRQEVFIRAQKRLSEGLSICIFPEGGVPDDESVVLDEFKDGAFRLAIDHQIPIVPMTFPDNKKRFSYTFFSGSPGLMRSKVHKFITTDGLELDDRKELKANVRKVIYDQLLAYNTK
ncbi:1-acyl-sn-glycerol-3-phosphate acyltransferase [uncultured Flavobacterium sp.]|uniref:lysophospholipid acyltransferase family protein n=1 Tax=uncultured Flavobacterium sp. TaxID=165435 RepID=UPI0025E19695|nr:lysophospholipid acyltransferase family protein [uncultured Flavobacterium sp.]